LSCAATKDGKAALNLRHGFLFIRVYKYFYKIYGRTQTMKYYFNENESSIDPVYFGYVEPMQISDLT
jgi:hypothetical protein